MCNSQYCFIIPPHILEQLAKQGNQSSKKALNDGQRILDRRNNVLNQTLVRGVAQGNADRYIYDSQSTYEQKLTLVRKEGNAATEDEVTNEAYDTCGYVRDYFKEVFNLNSVNGEGMDLVSNVHYGVKYNNAFWDGDEMTYGDGDNIEFKNFASAIDVVAHELVHGITQNMANLEYKGQSGALNEHFSDVFGTVIKQKYLKQDIADADWLIGDAVVTGSFPGIAIRSMKDPGSANDFDNQPDHMDNYYSGESDNQGVHINSGIPNKAFYLSCMALGVDECALIWFETLKKLWRTANFQDMLEVIIQTAKDLTIENQVSVEAEKVIIDSFSAVGLQELSV